MTTLSGKTLALATALVLAAGAASAWTRTTTNGAGDTATTTGSCARGGGALTCSSHTDITAPGGATGTRDRTTVITKTEITTTISGTRLDGKTFHRTTTTAR